MDEISDDDYVVYKHQFHYLERGIYMHYLFNFYNVPQGAILVLFEVSCRFGRNYGQTGPDANIEYERFHYSAEEGVMKKLPMSLAAPEIRNRKVHFRLGYTQPYDKEIKELGKLHILLRSCTFLLRC